MQDPDHRPRAQEGNGCVPRGAAGGLQRRKEEDQIPGFTQDIKPIDGFDVGREGDRRCV